MLDTMRANRRNLLTALLFGAIIFVFVVSFGPGSEGCQGRRRGGGTGNANAPVATVNGQDIALADFEQQYAQLYRLYQQQAGEGFSQELAEKMGLRQSALEQLVVRELILQDAKRQGLVVTDEELERSIKESPSFQSGGHFDHDYYTRATTSAYGSPARFEARMREDLLVQKMATLVRQSAKVTDQDVKEAFLADADRVNVQFVRFPLDAARADVKPTDQEVQAYAAANAKKIEDFYKANPAAFAKQKRVRARHILVKVDSTTSDAAAQQKAQQIADRARKGEDFAKLARETSQDDRTRAEGGELGEFGPGVMAKPFEDLAFSLKPGEIGGPVRTQFGWHVIKVEDSKETGGSLEAARLTIARQMLQDERAMSVARSKAESALAALRSGKSFADVFPPEGAKGKAPVTLGGKVLQPTDTGLFSPASGSVPRLGAAPELAAAAVAANGPTVLPKVYDTALGPVVAAVKERQRADEAQLPRKSAEIAERLRSQREGQVEQAWVAELRERAKVTINDQLVARPATATE